jgi:hypothetical protein
LQYPPSGHIKQRQGIRLVAKFQKKMKILLLSPTKENPHWVFGLGINVQSWGVYKYTAFVIHGKTPYIAKIEVKINMH